MRIDNIALERTAAGEAPPLREAVPAPTTTSAGDLFTSALTEAAQATHVAEAKAQALASGSLDDIHGTMIAAKEAEISVHLIGTIRNKLLDAFHELWRIGV